MDIEEIDAGQPFKSVIRQKLRKCRIMIVVIGPDWLVQGDGTGRPRLFDEDDWVSAEIEEGIRQKLVIIPVLVHDARLPLAHEVPEKIRGVLDRQAKPISISRFRSDMQGLVQEICNSTGVQRKTRGKSAWYRAAAASLASVVVAGFSYLALVPPSTETARQGGTVREAQFRPASGGTEEANAGGHGEGTAKPARRPLSEIAEQYSQASQEQQAQYKTWLTAAGYRLRPGLGGRDPKWSKPDRALKVGDRFTDCNGCPQMLVIPAAEFTMGAARTSTGNWWGAGADEGPPHQQGFKNRFAIGVFEITVEEYLAFLAQRRPGTTNPCYGNYQRDMSDPVSCVSFQDGLDFVGWLSEKTDRHYALPTEAQWEAAARAGTTTRYYFGDELAKLCDHANGKTRFMFAAIKSKAPACKDLHSGISPVGFYQPNPNGLFDMLGNVAEWVVDCWHDSYTGKPSPLRADGGQAWKTECEPVRRGDEKIVYGVTRGGSYDSEPEALQVTARAKTDPKSLLPTVGLRVVRRLDD